MKTPIVVTIAGTDPSGGAGIQADIKAISATGGYAASIITALVSQNTQGVQAIEEISSNFVHTQFASVFSDLDVLAVKIGMLYDCRIVNIVVDEVENLKLKNIVFDPVMVAKSGDVLLKIDTVNLIKTRLLKHIELLTPNIPEAEILSGQKIQSLDDMKKVAKDLGNEFSINILLKGGHLDDNNASDILYMFNENEYQQFSIKKIATKNTHGTGCTLSSAIASYLAQGFALIAAITKAKDYVTNAIVGTKYQKIGKGNGPLNHFYMINENFKN